MSDPFDIFHTSHDGTPLWRGTALTQEEALVRVDELFTELPGEYVILSRINGSKLVVRSDHARSQ